MFKMKKIIRLFFIISILFIIFLITYFSPREYSLDYKKDGVKIHEYYSKKDKYYKLSFNYKNSVYEFIAFDEYSKNRKLIDRIKTIEVGEYTCLIPESKELVTYPLCKQGSENISYHLVDGLSEKINANLYQTLPPKKSKYKNIEINALNDKTFLIWNYSGLDIINKEENKSVEIFGKDVYDISLAYLLNDYFVIPDYENDYRFHKIYLYNLKKHELSVWKLNNYIYFDSYILGSKNESLFIFDRKDKKEYEIVPHKEKIRTISPKVLSNGEWKKVSSQKLLNNKISFSEKEIIKYEIIDYKLYKIHNNYKELISKQKVKSIISYNQDEVYYLVDDSLFLFTEAYGEVKLMTFFEWNFNYENKIFVY